MFKDEEEKNILKKGCFILGHTITNLQRYSEKLFLDKYNDDVGKSIKLVYGSVLEESLSSWFP